MLFKIPNFELDQNNFITGSVGCNFFFTQQLATPAILVAIQSIGTEGCLRRLRMDAFVIF